MAEVLLGKHSPALIFLNKNDRVKREPNGAFPTPFFSTLNTDMTPEIMTAISRQYQDARELKDRILMKTKKKERTSLSHC